METLRSIDESILIIVSLFDNNDIIRVKVVKKRKILSIMFIHYDQKLHIQKVGILIIIDLIDIFHF